MIRQEYEAGSRDNLSEWEKIFSFYEEVRYFPSPVYESILSRPLSSVINLREIPDGQSIDFEDLETVTYFYNFSPENLKKILTQNKRKALAIYSGQFEYDNEVIKNSEGICLSRDRGASKTTIGEKLRELTNEGKKVTHIVCAEEIYGGETHYSTWRAFNKADIYEVGKSCSFTPLTG